ncbi:SGNH/GDSL hydrolase family protein [Arcticibacter tournemirensis]|uniref:Hydrolase n=1 Tax=Arcticibacter tournemirensis TaxID=699437 RepID=A0A4Q0M534_9SPHI|nr:SGNH/GDSL hydrolase family protein [Arcticibacter tournemirensis]RXF68034.1 hydrolase [Arcticibacter tournemirensis]
MKQKFYLFTCAAMMSFQVKAQLVYYDAVAFPLFGKLSDKTETRYERLPASLKTITRPAVWELGKNTAGLYIRFASNTTRVGLKWTLTVNRAMNHMTATGVKGFDLYCFIDEKWQFVNSARPNSSNGSNEATIVSNMTADEKEFLLYFPLYDGVKRLEIGIDTASQILPPKQKLPRPENPVICYGTSILQGGCASRPGMTHTNILSRWLNRELINLGFSGNGQLDYEIAEIISGYKSSLIILDFMPNVTAGQIRDRMKNFYFIIRKKSPVTPILFIENPIFPQGKFDQTMQETIKQKNEVLRKEFNSLLLSGDKHIRLLSSTEIIGTDGEATVDGIHFTDLGFMRYANFLYPYIKMYLDK